MIFVFILMGGLFGAFGWLFTAHHEHWYQRIIGFIIGTLFGIGFVFMLADNYDTAIERWDNGQCEQCSGSLEFSNATYWRGYHEYYYTCNECGHTEMFEHLMK